MKRITFLATAIAALFVLNFTQAAENQSVTLSNAFLSRTMTVSNGVLRTTQIENLRAPVAGEPIRAAARLPEAAPVGRLCNSTNNIQSETNQTSWSPENAAEFKLRVSKGTQFVDGDEVLSTSDFICTKAEQYKLDGAAGSGAAFTLENKDRGLTVTVRYELKDSDFFLRKRLEIQSEKPITLEYIEVDSIPAPDALQIYTCNAMTSQAPNNWRPNLGQPLYTTQTGTFWGVEFPAAHNTVENSVLQCGYLWGKEIAGGQTYLSYWSVCGAADDPQFVADCFQQYIDTIRAHAFRLQTQYNAWFDWGGGVNRNSFKASGNKINEELCVKRGVKPLSAYVIDDGWQENSRRIFQQAWPVNGKFDPDFASTFQDMKAVNSHLGLWLSPGCVFNCGGMVNLYRQEGYEALTRSMSLCGPKYMADLEKRMVELTQQGVCFFKLDGLFGHLNIRDFEITGRGCPAMPQLGTEGFSFNDARLNDTKYDELKEYYMVAGTERLMQIFSKMRQVNPDVYIVISNGAWLSPWWLGYVDTVWMINAGDAASGSDRTGELTYRDNIYHEIVFIDKVQFPLNALFNHEPKKNASGEPEQTFREYLFMHLTRGTGFVEMYLRPRVLNDSDWNVLAEGLKWADEIYPCFARARMFGDKPASGAPYGYSGWDGKKGYLSVHNPNRSEEKEITVTLDRAIGMIPNDGKTYAVKAVVGSQDGLNKTYKQGDTITFKLKPREIRVLQFDAM